VTNFLTSLETLTFSRRTMFRGVTYWRRGGWPSRYRLRYGLDGVQIPPMSRNFSLAQNIQAGSWAHPAAYAMGIGVLSWG
jgi:hypothetical protein